MNKIIKKLISLFQRKKTYPIIEKVIEGEDYIGIDNPNDPKDIWCCIKFIKPPYEGVIIKIGSKIRFATEKNENGSLNMGFDYEIIESTKKYTPKSLLKDGNFNAFIGGIIYNILLEYTKEQSNNEYGTNYNEESDMERRLL